MNRTNQWNIGVRNKAYHPWDSEDPKDPNDQFAFNYVLMDPGVRSSDDWDFLPRYTNVSAFPNIGWLGQVHRGTPWQTVFLKSMLTNAPGGTQLRAYPSLWVQWAGSIGTHPMRDWRLLDVFTTAANENAARGLLSVNQTNTAAWSAVLSGTIVASNTVSPTGARNSRNTGTDPTTSYAPDWIEPGVEVEEIVRSINYARANQIDFVRNPDPNAAPNTPYIPIWRTNVLAQKKAEVFRSVAEVVSAPALTVQSPYLKGNYEPQIRGVARRARL